jgi:prepilin-type N-terminal cleavage/methylation domain-containing protein
MPPCPRHGFTLIELSIVLVIIGLIAGGVLVGRDMIKAAQVRKVVADIRQFQSAVNTFKAKYGGLPGDLPQAEARAFGFTAASSSYPDTGNGNGTLSDALSATEPGGGIVTAVNGEGTLFWRQLSEAGLIAATIDGPLTADGSPSPDPQNVAEVHRYLPAAPNDGSYLLYTLLGPVPGPFVITVINLTYVAGTITNFGVPTPITGATIAPSDAFALDTKVDDGKPFSGSVIGNTHGKYPSSKVTRTNGFAQIVYPDNTAQACVVVAGADNMYNTSGIQANTPLCNLAFILGEISAAND